MALTRASETPAEARPARKPKLTAQVIDNLRNRIESGDLVPGAKLPTESMLVQQFGVSRTVVREAIAALAADGYVEPRQGAGVFVLARPMVTRIALSVDASDRLSTALNVLELRMAIEIEAAALAAVRKSAAQEAAMRDAFAKFERLMEEGRPTAPADFEFHVAIAAATNNPLYKDTMESLGKRSIPREFLAPTAGDTIHGESYLKRIHIEHEAILKAIIEGDQQGARDAMREHLTASQRRYQMLLQEYGRRQRSGEG